MSQKDRDAYQKRTAVVIDYEERDDAAEIRDALEIAHESIGAAVLSLTACTTLQELHAAYSHINGESERIAEARQKLHALIERIER